MFSPITFKASNVPKVVATWAVLPAVKALPPSFSVDKPIFTPSFAVLPIFIPPPLCKIDSDVFLKTFPDPVSLPTPNSPAKAPAPSVINNSAGVAWI